MNNVTSIESKQPAAAGAKFVISVSIEGFPVQVEVEGDANKLRGMIDRLKTIGATPPSSTAATSAPTNSDSAPVCEFHGAMKRSNHGGFYCPKKMGDGSYCKSKA